MTLSLREKLRKIGLPQNADGCDFSIDRNDPKMLLEHLIVQNEVQACETMMNSYNGLCRCFSKKNHDAFLEFGLGHDCVFI